MKIFEEPPDTPLDPREQAFHNMIREYVIFLIIFIALYGCSYLFIYSYKRRKEELDADEEDALVYRIAFCMCTFSLAVSIGAAFLLPFSIVSNEILLLYPDNYYMQWLNESLIHGLWNYVFIFSNVSLFVLLPFAYFFFESEGFSGSKRGLVSRINETIILLLFLSVLVFGMTYLLCCVVGYDKLDINNLFKVKHYFPFLYSCVSFLGVVLLLLFTPVGIARLFTVLGDLIVKPKLLKNVTEEYEAAALQKINIKRKIDDVTNTSLPMKRAKNLSEHTQDITKSITRRNVIVAHCSYDNGKASLQEMEKELIEINQRMKSLEFQKRASAFRRNFGYPIAMLVLLSLTCLAALMVVQNTLELLVGIKALPISSAQQFSIGIASLSKLGHIGAALEIVLILYLWCASVVGLYTLPIFRKLQPRLHDTSFTQIITNCALLLVLSSALPVLARTVGITNFDLLGDFGRIEWLGSFYVVLFYNLVFAVTTALTLTNKFTSTVRRELYKRLQAVIASFCWSTDSNNIKITTNGNVPRSQL